MCSSTAILVKDFPLKNIVEFFAVAVFRHKHLDKRQQGSFWDRLKSKRIFIRLAVFISDWKLSPVLLQFGWSKAFLDKKVRLKVSCDLHEKGSAAW